MGRQFLLLGRDVQTSQPLAELLGSDNYRADREMHLVELLQATFYFRCVTMNKEDVQRRMSAF